MRNWAFLFCGYFMAVNTIVAQQNQPLDTAKTLKVFEVVDSRLQWRDAAQNLISFSDSLPALSTMDFGDRLALEIPVFIRNYGVGSLSSLSVRGFSAQHVGFIWNGFNIQSPMNATADMSLFPTWLMEDVAFRQGPSTDSWGNGTIAGAVVSQTKYTEEPSQLSLHQSVGSFGLFNSGVKAQIQHKKLKVKIGAMRRFAENDFPFRDHSHPDKLIRRQQNATFEALDLMASAHYAFNQKHAISLDFWGFNAERSIPVIMSVPNNSSIQKDESIKNNLAYYYFGKQSKITFRSAYFTEKLDFEDSLIQIDSKSDAVSFMNDFLYELQLKNEWRLSVNVFQGNYAANSTGYQGIRATQQRWVGMAAVEKILFNDRMHITARIRKEWLDSQELPYTPGFNIGYQLPRSWSFNGGGAMSYRVPTFNDLYWLPGGNPLLNPEDGRHLQMNVSKAIQTKTVRMNFKTMLYRSEVANWIQWQPQNATVWTPSNIKSVINQGVEIYARVEGKIQDWQWYFQGNATFVKAEGQQSHLDNDQAQGYQLIYVPQHHANAQIGISRKNFNMMFYHQYTGLRYTASDHSQFLPAFSLSGIQVSQQLKGKRNACQIFAACNNIFNTDYQVMLMRAMPGRNFQVGVTYNFVKKGSRYE